MLDDPRVVAGREPGRADPAREREELREPEAAVAARARVRRLAAGVAPDEGLDDRAPERVAEIERHVRKPTLRGTCARAARTASGEQQARSTSGPSGSIQRRSVTPTAPVPAREERNRRVDAAAHRHRDPAGVGARADDRPEGVRERVHGQRLAADRGRLEQREPAQVVRQAVRVGVDDPVAVDPEPDERELRAARRVSDQLAHCPSR